MQIIFFGDSTIDNRVWVDGLVSSFINSRLGVVRESAEQRVEMARSNPHLPLSVVEHVMSMLPDAVCHDLTNDGFTTSDCLKGQFRDKVFGIQLFSSSNFSIFPHELFAPLVEGREHLSQATHIVISVGGNNFREFLKEASRIEGAEQHEYIRTKFHPVLAKMRAEYIKILQTIRELNPQAQLIVMTQYYPSTTQNSYALYPFMHQVGKILNMGGPDHDPLNVIHEIMQLNYAELFKKIPSDNLVVADVTSSLNPYIDDDHVHQIEPSSQGGGKIAQMLRYVMTSNKITAGNCYRFYPDFFTAKEQDLHVESTVLANWQSAHPTDLEQGYSLLEETLYREKQGDTQCLLDTLKNTAAKYPITSPLHKAAMSLAQEATELVPTLSGVTEKNWKISILLAIHVLENPNDRAAINRLRENAARRSLGRGDHWQMFIGALIALAGVALIALSVAIAPFSAGYSLLGLLPAGGLTTAGVCLFHSNRKQAFPKSLECLAGMTAKADDSARGADFAYGNPSPVGKP